MRELPYGRPYLICFEHCKHVKILDVKLTMSPAWTVHPLYCEDLEVRGISIRNPWNSPNTDGINPDGCQNVRIAKCPVGAIQMKEGYPVWKSEECEMCLGCLHRCPKFAISYGNGKTNRHGQYKNPYTKVER